MTFEEYIVQHSNPSDALLQALSEASQSESPSKNTVLLREGDICHKIYFVQKGILRFYYYDKTGKDFTHWFAFEGAIISEVDSLLGRHGSVYYLETLEDCTLTTLTIDTLVHLLDNFPEFSRFWAFHNLKILLELGEKLKDLQFRSATEQYQRLINKYPDILQRVSLGHIASYLGIAQQSLSRIRSGK